jgi:hypothetical protein
MVNMKISAFALLLVLSGCQYIPGSKPESHEFKVLEDACPRMHMYWRILCDERQPYCIAKAWTGSSDPWSGHTQEWRVFDNDKQIAAARLAEILPGPPNVDLTNYKFDSGVKECKPTTGKKDGR